jgi:hypothetical protein
MSHIHWVEQQNKLEIPRDKDEVNKQDIHECDERAHDSDTMVTPPTPKPTLKAETLTRAPSTIVSSRKEDTTYKEVTLPRYRCARCILETKTKAVGRGTGTPQDRDERITVVKTRGKDKTYKRMSV